MTIELGHDGMILNYVRGSIFTMMSMTMSQLIELLMQLWVQEHIKMLMRLPDMR